MTYWQCYTVTTPTARKERLCSGCYATIKPGDQYTLTSGLFEYEWTRWKDCGRCIPVDGCYGWWAAPEEVLSKCEDYYWWDGALIAPDSVDRHGGEKATKYEAIIVPLAGLMDWVEVAA